MAYSEEDLARLLAKTDWTLPLGHLSPSQVWSYVACGSCFEAERILRVPKPVSADLLIGLQAHRAAQRAREAILDGKVDPANPTADLEEWVEAGATQFDGILAAGAYNEDGDALPVEIELTKKYADLGEAKDKGVAVIRATLPEMVKYDLAAGVEAAEARVWGLGAPLDPDTAHNDDEAQDYADEAAAGLAPVFPGFSVKAYLDVKYPTAIKDFKTSSRKGVPDDLAKLQLIMYGLPWAMAGDAQDLGWDVTTKTKEPEFASYWLKSLDDPELRPGQITDAEYRYALWRVLRAAEGISAGRFEPNEASFFHKYSHGLPDGERAVFFEQVAS